MKLKLTTPNLELPAGKKEEIFWDTELTGFGLRVRRGSGGVIRNWVIQYRQHGRAPRMIVGSGETLTAAQARAKARKLLAEVELGGDPQNQRRERREKDSLSLRSVVADFIAHKTGDVKEGTLRMLRSYLEGPLYLRPLHGVAVDRITRKDIAARLLVVSKTSGVPTAIAFRSALSSLFVWAMQMGLVEHNPLLGAFKPKQPASRERVLSGQELAAVWQGVEDDGYGRVVKLLTLTACRRSEIGGMRWSEFAFDKGTWTLPKARSKTGKPHTLPLTPLMLQIIESVPRREGFDLLFGRKHGFTGWSIGKRALDERLGLPAWRIHDIRRSCATQMANIGIQPHIIEEILGHRSGHKAGVAGIYNRSPYEREVKAAMGLWADHVRSLVDGEKRKVIPLR